MLEHGMPGLSQRRYGTSDITARRFGLVIRVKKPCMEAAGIEPAQDFNRSTLP
jgi:hypothetical protein